MAPAMPCKRSPNGITKVAAKVEIASEKIPQTIHGCIVESHESTRQRVESSQPEKHEDHIAGKGFTSMSHYNLVHKFIPVPQVMKLPDAKAAVDKEWKNTRDDPSVEFGKSQEQKEGSSGATKRQKESPLCTLMDICHLKNAELEPKLQKYKGRVVLWEDIVKDDSGAHAVFT